MCTCDLLAGFICGAHVRQYGGDALDRWTTNRIRYPKPNRLGLTPKAETAR